jgi:hypothetical protein
MRIPTIATWKQKFDHLQSCTHIAAMTSLRDRVSV